MASKSIIVLSFFRSLFFTTLLSVTITAAVAAAAIPKPGRPVAGVVHRQDSTLFPYHRRDTIDEIQANLVVDEIGQTLLVNISIGTPPVPQLVSMDTGSDLLWVQCRPCGDCFRQSTPIFNPSKSSTYVDLPNGSPVCPCRPRNNRNNCNYKKRCMYDIEYVNRSSSSGNLAIEHITFKTSDQGTATVSPVLFGCGHSNRGPFDGLQSGILGLSPSDKSIASQLGSRFSYCIGYLSDPHYIHNKLSIGAGVKMEGSSTPFRTFDGFYYVTLEGISIGETRLDIDPRIFQKAAGRGGVVLDSGTTGTVLAKEGYIPVRNEIEKVVSERFRQVIDRDFPGWPCYKGKVKEELEGFPLLTFHFAEGADLVLDANSLFVQNDEDEFCLAIFDSDPGSLEPSVIGIMAQQHYNVSYDLFKNRVYFQRRDCQLLED